MQRDINVKFQIMSNISRLYIVHLDCIEPVFKPLSIAPRNTGYSNNVSIMICLTAYPR